MTVKTFDPIIKRAPVGNYEVTDFNGKKILTKPEWLCYKKVCIRCDEDCPEDPSAENMTVENVTIEVIDD